MNATGHLGMATTFAALYQYNMSIYTAHTPSILSYTYTSLCFAAAILGGKAPDWDLLLVEDDAPWQKRCQIHRQTTHSLAIIVALLVFCIFMAKINPWWEMATYFAVGLFSHLVADVVTGTVPIGFYADNRKTYARIGIRNQTIKNLFVSFGQFFGPVLFLISFYQFFMYASTPGYNVIGTIRTFIGSF